MAVWVRHRAVACGILAACGLALLSGTSLGQQGSTSAASSAAAGTDDSDAASGTPSSLANGNGRLSDQRLVAPLRSQSPSLAPPMGPGSLDLSTGRGARLGSERPDSGPSTRLPDATPSLLDNPGVSQRENRRDPAAARASEAEDVEAPPRRAAPLRAEAAEAGAPSLFQAIGPVRSPTLDEIGNRRLTDGLASLRRIVPGARTTEPFAPLGTRIGSFLGYLTLDQSLGVSDNLTVSRDGVKGAFSQTTLAARLISDWSRHEAELNAAATYRRNFAGPLEEEPQIDADGRLRLDLTRDTTAVLRGAVSFSRQDDLTAGVAQDAASRADVLRYSFGAELDKRFGQLDTTASLQAVRDDLSDRAGGNRSLDDSFTTYTAGLKATLSERAALHPFLAASLGRRVFDRATTGGLSRDSLIPALRGGLGFDRGEKFSGELALGYAWNLPDDDSLPTIGSPTIDALLNWSPRRGTDVTLRGATFFEPETTGLDTATLYQISLGLRHRATARLDLNGTLIAGLRDRERLANEYVYSGEAGFTYWLNRHLALTGLYRYDRFEAAFAGNSYDANSVRLGVRLQN
ncbi:outer membrane beta-barrel protein [Aureimonas sp. AU40]|uniref:outer membrane beta-barrel protein n=1 Tax=Aureimonas sp. AU40 TaxID=1637747 RepID=UPI0007838A93|nr:outer membrane beta-barrel protein [Aureimonas sp. AU40]